MSYPTDMPNLPSITRSQIHWHAAKLSLYKAPGPDGIPNIILTRCIDTILEHVYYIYRAVFDIGVYYDPWKHWNTIVLRKLGKVCYDTAKSYCPIALLNTLHKLLTSITTDMSCCSMRAQSTLNIRVQESLRGTSHQSL